MVQQQGKEAMNETTKQDNPQHHLHHLPPFLLHVFYIQVMESAFTLSKLPTPPTLPP